MSKLDYIGADELVFNNDVEQGIHSGGFSVKSVMMKAGMSPIMTVNNNQLAGGSYEKVSDLFNDLVIPNWTLSYNNRIMGGKYTENDNNDNKNDNKNDKNDNENEDKDDIIDDDLHDRLLELVKEHNVQNQNQKEIKKKLTRRVKKNLSKKGGTKRKKQG